jgi:4-amino-4-deoxy-L-arabinose transferase-like glycosyltransferase
LYQGLSVGRRWLALVLILFCFPLFVGLRSLDLETDEAIYSFAVDKILEDGEWLQPKSSPSETAVFLEKPPLKFWIVAAPIRLGLLPHDEFGLRFWDALFGAVAFAYVFAIGVRMAGPVCGGVAALALFVHWPLLLDHGLRTNNMEGALFLSYCGGVYHFLAWGSLSDSNRRRHALAASLYFVLGFLTKFVAAIFLPLVLAISTMVCAPVRRRFWDDRAYWGRAAMLALLLIAPWFLYAQALFGSLLWHTMLAEHVYARFTTGLNQAHLHPWFFYFTTLWDVAKDANLQWFVPAGLVTLAVQSVRRRSFEGTTVLLWAVIPLLMISLGSSKLYHYAYPFLPPVALAVGYLFALVMMLAPVVIRRLLAGAEGAITRVAPAWSRIASRPRVGGLLTAFIWLAAGIAVWTLLFEQARIEVGTTVLFKSSGILRPILAIAVAAALAGRSGRVAALVVALALAWCLPIHAYKDVLGRLTEERHPLRDASLCIQRVEGQAGQSGGRGLYVDTDSSMWHPIYYYFRRIQPWTRQEQPSPDLLDRMLHDPAFLRPSLVQELRYRDYLSGPDGVRFRRDGTPPIIGLYEYALLLPGPYRACSPEASLRASR